MMSKPIARACASVSAFTIFPHCGLRKTRGIAANSGESRLSRSSAMTATGHQQPQPMASVSRTQFASGRMPQGVLGHLHLHERRIELVLSIDRGGLDAVAAIASNNDLGVERQARQLAAAHHHPARDRAR